MSTNPQAGTQTFNTAFPLDFTIKNQFQGEDLAVLYIVSNKESNPISQKLKVQISSSDDGSYTLKGFGFDFISPKTASLPTPAAGTLLVPNHASYTPMAGKNNYNLAFAVRPGTLRTSVQNNFGIALYKAISKSFGDHPTNSCVVNGPIIRKSDGALVWYVAFQHDIAPPASELAPVSEWTKVDAQLPMSNITYNTVGQLWGLYIDDSAEPTQYSHYMLKSIKDGQWILDAGNTNADLGCSLYSGPAHQQSLRVETDNTISISYYGGVNWTPLQLSDSVPFINSAGQPNGAVAVSKDNELYQSYVGNQWQHVPDSTHIIKVAVKEDGTLYGISTDGYLQKRKGVGSEQWKPIDSSNTKLTALTLDFNANIIAYGADNCLYKEVTNYHPLLFEFELEGISAEAGSGTRNSQIEMLFGNVSVDESANKFSFKRSQDISIVNHEGHSYAPLHFGLIGDTALLNKEGHHNSFSLFFETTNGKPIQLNQSPTDHTKIHFNFPYSDSGKNLMPFGNSSEVKGYKLTDSEAYPFKTSGPSNPLTGGSYSASENDGGSIQFTAEFKGLSTEQQAKQQNPTTGISTSKALFETEVSPTDGIGKKIATAAANAKILANFISANNGPMQYFLYANGVGTTPTVNEFYGTGKGFLPSAPASSLIPVNLSPSPSNPFVSFDQAEWTSRFNTAGSHVPFTDPNAPSVNINSWNVLPSSYTPLSTTYSFKHNEFLLYVMTNFNTLVRQLKALNPAAVGKCPAPNGQNVDGIFPSKAVFEFFMVQYNLYKDINSADSLSLGNLGVQQYANYQSIIDRAVKMKKLMDPTLELITFFDSQPADGWTSCSPVLASISVMAGQANTVKGIFTTSQNPAAEYFGWSLTKPGTSVGTFSTERWKKQYTAYSNTLLNDNNGVGLSTSAWDTMPEGMSSDYETTPSWETGFLNYITDNFDYLLNLYIQLLGVPDPGTKLSYTPIPPCKAVYKFFNLQYQLYQLENTLPDYMIDITETYAKPKDFTSNWNVTFAEAYDIFGSNSPLLTHSKIDNSSQNWSNSDFISYLISNNEFQTLCEAFKFYGFHKENCVVPSQALYDYLWSNYQSTLPAPTPETHAELYAPSSYAFHFSDIQTSGDDGWVTVGIRVENLPGYWDSSFQVSIRRSQTIFAPTLALGHGGPNGRTTIIPTDPNYTNTEGLTPGSRIDFLSAGHNQNKQPNVSIEEYYGLNIYGTLPEEGQTGAVGVPTQAGKDATAGQPVKIKQADLLVEDGRLGIGNVPEHDISGDFSNPAADIVATNPNEKLRVVGDSYLNGHARVSGDLGVGGHLGIAGDLSLQGKLINTNNETLVPPGTIIQLFSSQTYGYSYDNITAPKGWLPCNGSNYDNNTKTTPDIKYTKVNNHYGQAEGAFYYFIKV